MATVLEARGVGVAWAASAPVLKDVSFVLEPGFHGLVGANGAGKTTLLRVLAGDLAPHEGAVHLRGRAGAVAYCPQNVDAVTDDVRALAAGYDGLAAELKGRLELEDDRELDRWGTLSPGERKRWQIGAALAREPDVLLLDEPTNHLDGGARDRLLAALGRFRGIGVVVSHDRAVLERLPRAILRVHDTAVTLYKGRYSEALRTWEEARKSHETAHARGRATVRSLARQLDFARRTQESASRSISSRSRMKSDNDSDGRSLGAKNRARSAEAKAGRTLQVVRDELERARADVHEIERDRTQGGKVFVSWERAPQPALFHIDTAEIRAGEHVVLRDVRVTIGREERVRVAGDNGAGKTTLLASLLASRQGIRGQILYLPQELEPGAVARLASDLRTLADEERGRVLAVFAALGSDPERLLSRRSVDAAALSPGEARKLALALALGRNAWALVLDEPTNHLDLPTIERLERALVHYPGAVVVVTHDDAFARAVTSRTLHVGGGIVA